MESKSVARSESLTRRCAKCRAQEATLDSRSQAVCKDCFMNFIATKCIKQIAILGKETRPPPSTSGGPPTGTRRYLLGLSLGVSSTVLLHLLNGNIEFQLGKGRNAPFELVVVHVDTSNLSSEQNQPHDQPSAAAAALDAYRQRYPRFTFHCVPLSSIFDPSTPTPIDWSSLIFGLSLPKFQSTSNPQQSLHSLLTSLPRTAAAHADILRLLTRHILVSQSHLHNCQALLLGHSTTALAELTLAETAKGRGFSLPWLINDGPSPIDAIITSPNSNTNHTTTNSNSSNNSSSEHNSNGTTNTSGKTSGLLVYHPLRDALRAELRTYAALASLAVPADADLAGPATAATSATGGKTAVVSHKDLSIEQVMANYFAEVETNYPSVVANVARTTGKLVRIGLEEGGEGGERCGLCRMPLDEAGDERWRGELGEGIETQGDGGKLCYGCERSTVR
ncbi:Cytoplasmic tRNA 2-thiolation protein 2 [Madurella fahalii]|uniref:Cytoplasmic tRNA 2-thiolation protein 2 n=1 Tax=Madurella fahalii TaxID=1157608 RepID=A0ABQ0GSU7_9PEZI